MKWRKMTLRQTKKTEPHFRPVRRTSPTGPQTRHSRHSRHISNSPSRLDWRRHLHNCPSRRLRVSARAYRAGRSGAADPEPHGMVRGVNGNTTRVSADRPGNITSLHPASLYPTSPPQPTVSLAHGGGGMDVHTVKSKLNAGPCELHVPELVPAEWARQARPEAFRGRAGGKGGGGVWGPAQPQLTHPHPHQKRSPQETKQISGTTGLERMPCADPLTTQRLWDTRAGPAPHLCPPL